CTRADNVRSPEQYSSPVAEQRPRSQPRRTRVSQPRRSASSSSRSSLVGRARPATCADARPSHDVDIASTRVLYTRDQQGPANIEFVLQRSRGAAYADRIVRQRARVWEALISTRS